MNRATVSVAQPADEPADAADHSDDSPDSTVIPLRLPTLGPLPAVPAPPAPPTAKPGKGERVRMTGKERREQLLQVARRLFAEKGFEAVTIEEIAAKANVSKPVVYEHFGSKDGIYAVIVDREMNALLVMITGKLTGGHPRQLLEQAGLALFDYIEASTDGFRILTRDSPVTGSTGTFASLILDVAAQVEHLLAKQFEQQKLSSKLAPMYSRMLVGMVALTGEWWVDVRKPKKEEVVAHLVNLAWNGLANLEKNPRVSPRVRLPAPTTSPREPHAR